MKRLFLNFAKNLILLFILLLPVSLRSQSVSLVQGDSLRWKVDDQPDWQYGRLIDLRNDTLFAKHKNKLFVIPVKHLKEFEIAKGWKTNGWKGAGYGALIGGGILGTLVAIENSSSENDFVIITPTQAFVAGFIVGALPTAVIGGIVGSGIHSVVWKKIEPKNLRRIAVLTPKPEIVKKDSSQIKTKVLLTETQKVGQDTTLSTTNPQPRKPVRSIKNKLKKRRNLEFSVLLSWNKSGANDAIENQMISSGFGDEYRGWFGPTTHPHSDPAFGFIASVKIHLKQKFDIGLQGGHLGFGKVYGYNKQSGSYLTIGSGALFINPMLYLKSSTPFQIGFGPAYYSAAVSQEALTSITKNQSKNLWGFTGEFDIMFPQTTTLLVNLKLQFRYISPTTIGPFMTLNEENRLTFPKLKVNYSMFLLGLGVGLGD